MIATRVRLHSVYGCVLFLVASLYVEAFSFGQYPNVVLILTDDQGYGDLACNGNPVIKTPHLDKLSEVAFQFTNYHVSPTCSPTRAALLTGRWSNRTGVWHTIMGRSLLRADEVTLADYFQRAGYATGMFGKWHLGDNAPFRPEDRGFEAVVRHGGGGVGQAPDYWDNAYFDDTYWKNGTPTKFSGYCTDVFFSEAMTFIEQQRQASRPFFAYIATNAPHGPMHAPPGDAALYSDQEPELANFYGMITNIDHNVGRLRQYLDDAGLADNTVFIFTTDNGTSSGASVFNDGMRGAKGSPYDGGHRVPFFIHWPAGGFNQSNKIATLCAHVDVLPTLLQICSIDEEPSAIDGRSLLPLLEQRRDNVSDATSSEWESRVLVTDSQRVRDPVYLRQSAVMTQRWRLINGAELYDMEIDPGQRRDVAEQFPEVVSQLRDAYQAWWASMEASYAETARIYLGDPRENLVHLSSHDWLTNEMSPWNQAQVRNGLSGEQNTGYWALDVRQAGRYRVVLCRWPRYLAHPIVASLPAASPSFGARAFRETPGKALAIQSSMLKIDSTSGKTLFQADQKVNIDSTEIIFEASLPVGPINLDASFRDSQGIEYGAYYVDVELVEPLSSSPD